MTTNIKTKAINLREIAARVMSWKPTPKYTTFYWEFDGSSTVIPLPRGWEPVWVDVDDALLRGNLGVALNADLDAEFNATNDGLGTWSITFPNIYPPTSSAMIYAKLEL